MLSLWQVMKLTYKYDHHDYDRMFSACAMLTNYHLIKNPLREQDGTYYNSLMSERIKNAEERIQKRKESRIKYQKKAQEKRKRRQEVDVRSIIARQ